MNSYKNIYILLTDTGTLLNKMIGLYTKAAMNHASIALDKELYEVYSFGRKDQSNPFQAGFVKENMRGHIFEQAKCSVYTLRVPITQYDSLRAIIQSFETNEHCYSYNLLGLVLLTLNLPVERKYAYFCSEFVASTLSRAGISVTDKPAPLVKPCDFAHSPSLQLVFQGKLQHYLEHRLTAEAC
jgi:hypothetical protein